MGALFDHLPLLSQEFRCGVLVFVAVVTQHRAVCLERMEAEVCDDYSSESRVNLVILDYQDVRRTQVAVAIVVSQGLQVQHRPSDGL